MSEHSAKAIRMMMDAKPASGYRPETEAEWSKLQAAVKEMAYASLRSQGMAHQESRALAELMLGGHAGRLILDMSYSKENRDGTS